MVNGMGNNAGETDKEKLGNDYLMKNYKEGYLVDKF